MSTAKDGRLQTESFVLILLRESAQSLFRVVDVFLGQPSALDHVCHEQIGPAAEYTEDFIDKSPLYRRAGNRGLEDMGVADLLGPAQGFLCLKSINRCLHGRVGRPIRFGKRLLNLA